MLHDAHGRQLAYLRLSLTTACAMRCTYCRPRRQRVASGESMLTVEEIGALVGHLVARHGLRKVRLTGGDPTSRPELTAILARLAAIPGLADLAMTTNGLTLANRAAAYAAAGLRRVNVSLDALDRERFRRLTGVDGLARVLAGLDAAEAAGLAPIRLNTVVVRGHNEADLPALLAFAAVRGWELRFIELMPMGPLAGQWSERFVPEAEMRDLLAPVVRTWEPLAATADAARRHRAHLRDGRTATVGFITPMSCHFCATCNRIRVAADGTLQPCLMGAPGPSLLPALRPHYDADRLDALLAVGLRAKQPVHAAHGQLAMIQIGG